MVYIGIVIFSITEGIEACGLTHVFVMEFPAEFVRALEEIDLQERPEGERANEFLERARRLAEAEELP